MTETQTQVSPKPEAKTPWPQQNIPIKDIEIGERLRPLDEKEVEEKVKSITELSLLNPITVSRHPTRPTIGGDPFPRPRYLLRAGLHRLEACKRLKWKEIPAVITTLIGPRADLIEVDENLMQTTLTPVQRGIFTKKRKELYEAIYPYTAKGKAQGEGKKRSLAEKGTERKVCGEIDAEAQARQPSFVEDTAAQTGRSERSIELDAERGEKVVDDVMQSVTGSLDKGVVLDELKQLPPEQQRERVKELQAAPPKSKAKQPSKGKSVPKAADAILEHKGTPAKDLTAQLDPCFKALWQLSVDLKKSEVREWADKIERALEKKGIVPASERQRDAKGYLARIKPKADKPDAEPKPATDINGQVDEIVSRILIEDEEFRRLLEALDPEQAVEGDLKTDDHMAALKIREAAIRNGISPLATEQLATIRRALNVVMRRYGISRKERREEARQAAPAAIAAA